MSKKLMIKKVIILVIIVLFILITSISENSTYAKLNLDNHNGKMINVGVAISDFNDGYLSKVKESLEEIQSKNEGTVKFTFYNGENSEKIQNKNMNSLVNGGYDLILANLHDTNGHLIEEAVNKIKQTNKPLILFNIKPLITPLVSKSYSKMVIISKDAIQSGILEGKMLINEWNNNINSTDKNNDGVLQYIMIANDDTSALKYAILTLNNAGIRTQELVSKACDWNRNCDTSTIENLFMRYGDKVEAIITNNDAMALSTVEILQKYGYNKNNGSKYVLVIGSNGTSKTKELVDKGFMSGTIIQDPNELANTIYTVGMNLVSNKDPLLGVNFTFNETGNTIEMPYIEYKKMKPIG